LLRTVCAMPSGRAAMGLYGKMPGVALPDYVEARLIVVWGVNPSTTGIHFVPYVQEAHRRGARLVVVNPLRINLATQAHQHLAVRPGTDLALALALHRWLFENGAADLAFLAAHTRGADELRRRAAPWTIDRAAEVCGLAAEDIEAFARLYAASSPAVIRCGWGLERNRNGGSAVAAVLALPAVAGKFGVRGGGYTLSNSAAWKFAPERAIAEPEPATRAVNMNKLGDALCDYDAPPVKALFVYNNNALATSPNQAKIERGLGREDLFTVVFDQVMTDTARWADVLLPATAFTEHRELSRGYGAFVMHRIEPVSEAAGESRGNVEVFAELVRRLGLEKPGDPLGPDALERALLAEQPDPEATARALDGGGVAIAGVGTHPVQFVDVFPRTPDGKVDLVPDELDREAPAGLYGYRDDPASEAYPLALVSPATNRTISSYLGQLRRGIVPVALSPSDAAARRIENGDRVRIWNEGGEVQTTVRVTADVRPGTASLPKGLWMRHTLNGRTGNVLAPDTLTDLGGGACFNDARVQVARV
jgi:anaerobic selenocysteine-containing dehydrogenase